MRIPGVTFAVLALALAVVENAFCSTQEEAIRLLAKMKAANSAVADLRCHFTMEITKNKKRLQTQRMIFRYKTKPETIHLTYLQPHKGRKVLYVRGNQKMKVRPDGFWKFTTVAIDPNSEKGMQDGIDPITAQGFPQIVAAAERLIQHATADPAYSIAMQEQELEGCGKCIELEIHAGGQEEYKLLVNSSTHFPWKIMKQNSNGAAVYSYENIEINLNMPESEFKL